VQLVGDIARRLLPLLADEVTGVWLVPPEERQGDVEDRYFLAEDAEGNVVPLLAGAAVGLPEGGAGGASGIR
jgi:hypothetical protein